MPDGFWDDMRYLRSLYQWDDPTRDEMLAWVQGDPQAVRYCRELARTWRLAEAGTYELMILEAA